MLYSMDHLSITFEIQIRGLRNLSLKHRHHLIETRNGVRIGTDSNRADPIGIRQLFNPLASGNHSHSCIKMQNSFSNAMPKFHVAESIRRIIVRP